MMAAESDPREQKDADAATSGSVLERTPQGPSGIYQFGEDTCVLARDQVSFMFSQLWKSYRDLVRTNRGKFEVADEAINRLLFWVPHSDLSGNEPPWREMVYGLLSVNRLAMYCSQQDYIENSYGTTVRTIDDPTIQATSIRIALSVIHCLMPSTLELFHSDPSKRAQRQTQMRLRLEQIKFGMRLYLLYSYWKQILSGDKESAMVLQVPPGILMDGGLYHIDQPEGLTAFEVDAMERRRNYVGRRTGLRIGKGNSETKSESPAQLILAEALHIARPLLWASAESRNYDATEHADSPASKNLLKAWFATLAMDLLSLGLLRKQRNDNPVSKTEWDRRRMKLFLYMLRSPVWSKVSSPALERTSSVILRVPLLGSLIDAYIWDWVLYWKHPYVSEEG